GVLHDASSAAGANGQETCRSVMKGTGEYDADHTPAIVPGGGAEQRIDRRPVKVLACFAAEPDFRLRPQYQVLIGRSDVAEARVERLTIGRMGRQNRSRPAEDFGENASGARREVADDKHGGGKPSGQPGDDLGKSRDSPR